MMQSPNSLTDLLAELRLEIEPLQLTRIQKQQLIRDILKEAANAQASIARREYATPEGIVRFVEEKICRGLGIKLAPYQKTILAAVVIYRKVAVCGPHGLGKTFIAACIVLWILYVYQDDVKAITTASVWRQVEKFLWPEIRRLARQLDWGDEKPRVLDLSIKFPNRAKEAFAVVSDDPQLIEGAHAQTLVYIFDESKAIADDTFDAVEGAFSGAGPDTDAEAFALAFSTPGDTSGRFYDIFQRKPGLQDWHTIYVELDECIQAGRVSREWAENRKLQWGEDSAIYQNRVAGKFSSTGEDSVIPLRHVELANERWYAANGKGAGGKALGVDPARYGTDKTAVARLVGNVIESLTYTALEDTMQTTGRVAAIVDKRIPVAVDVIGIGAGVTDRLKELEYNVTGVNVASSAVDTRKQLLKDITDTFTFINLRSYIWWLMRDMLNPLNPDCIALPPDDDLTADLVAPKYVYTSTGQIKVESKDDIRKRLKRSTDGADAVGLALFVRQWAVMAAAQATGEMRVLSVKDPRNRSNFGRKLSVQKGRWKYQ